MTDLRFTDPGTRSTAKNARQLRPIGDRVIVRMRPDASITPGGVIIPEQAKDRPTRGDVLAVGPGKVTETGILIEPSVAVGDVAVFTQYAGADVLVAGEKLKILRESEILAVDE